VTGEFALIDLIHSRLAGPPGSGQVWVGDDAAVVRVRSGPLLLTADTLVAGVHADLSLTGVDDFGWKALAVSVSDIAAMGGDPAYALVAVSAPAGTDFAALFDGLSEAADEIGCPIVGGDTTSAGALVVTVAVVGHCDGDPVLRSGARPDDEVWVTGALGASAAGLRLLRAGAAATGEAAASMRAHARPQPHVAEGAAARRAGASAMIDVSDGLTADLRHLATASGVGFNLQDIPRAPGATLAEALGGGDDYVLAFTAPPRTAVAASFAGLRTPVRIGRCTTDPAEMTVDGNEVEASGWEHRF
jgi:thiamine-monophosphate kinase